MKQTIFQVTKLHSGIWALDSRHGQQGLAETVARGLVDAGSSVRVVKVTPAAPGMRENEERIVFQDGPKAAAKTAKRRVPTTVVPDTHDGPSYVVIMIRLLILGVGGLAALYFMQVGAGL